MATTLGQRCRSVLDYDGEDALRKALLSVDFDATSSLGDCDHSSVNTSSSTEYQLPDDDADLLSSHPHTALDWVLPDYDPETSEVQSMKQELQRLQVLKSYLLLDCDRERSFDRITDLASRIFEAPVSMMSLIDVGRAWLLSNVGVDEAVREGPRRLAFCAHTILTKANLMVVPDATLDPRFRDSPYVAVEGGIRFYAGVALVSPEGYKLGTLCVVDGKPWPNGITDQQKATLKDLGEMAVEIMVQRRKTLHAASDATPAELIACTSHDLLTPLSGTLLSLSLLKDDADVQRRLDTQQFDLLCTATTCSELMVRLCESSINSLRASGSGEGTDATKSAASGGTPGGNGSSAMGQGDAAAGTDGPITKMDELVKSLHVIMEPIPKRVPVVIRLDSSVPPTVVCDDLKLFRSALNLLSSAVRRTARGFVNLRIYQKADTSDLVFECEDTGDAISPDQYDVLYRSCSAKDGDLRLSLYSVARAIGSMGGTFGFHPRDKPGRYATGSVFWFCVPLRNAHDSLRSTKVYAHRDPIIVVSRNDTGVAAASSHPPLRDTTTTSTTTAPPPKPKLSPSGADCFKNLYHTVVASRDTKPLVAPSPQPIPIPSSSSTEGTPRPIHVAPPTDPRPAATPSVVTVSTENDSPRMVPPRIRRALVVDDSLVVRKSLAMALKKLGYDVSMAVDGLEGLNHLKATLFDVTFCDFLMPVMDGFDCVKQYRAWEVVSRPEFRQLIVGISAHADQDIAAQGLAAGMDDFRSKPIGIKVLKNLHESDAVRDKSQQIDDLQSDPSGADPEGATVMMMVENDSSDTLPVLQESAAAPPPPLVLGQSSNATFHELSPGASSSSCSSSKRMRPSSEHSRDWRNPEPNVLIAASQPGATSSDLVVRMEGQGWKVTTVQESTMALRLLQARNWDAVLVDDELSSPANHRDSSSIASFREWERQNRVNLQKNVCLLTDLDLPALHDTASVVQPPAGYDAVLHKPVQWTDLRQLLDRGARDSSLTIVVNKK